MTLYSQSHEIENYLDQFFPQYGFFLEIGCWDAEMFSQTAYLERERKWDGLCVDPFPVNFNSRNCLLNISAVSKDGLPRTFVKVTVDRRDGGDVSYFSGFKDNLKTYWETIQEYCEYTEIRLDTITMQDLYELYSLPDYIEFLSLDTEGSELEILSSIDLNRYRYGMIAFEHNANEPMRRQIGDLLLKHDYRFFLNMGWDDIYVWRGLK